MKQILVVMLGLIILSSLEAIQTSGLDTLGDLVNALPSLSSDEKSDQESEYSCH